MSRIGKKPVPVPGGRHRHGRRPDGHGEGPEGRAAVRRCTTTSRSSSTTAQIKVDPRDETKRARAHVGHCRARMVANLVERRHQGLREEAGDHRRRLPRRGAGQEPAAALGYSHDVDLPIPEGITIAAPKPTEIVDHRHRQAAGRPGRRRDPRLSGPEPYKGKGVQVRRRIHLPQGRQEEVRSARHGNDQRSPSAAQGARAPHDPARAPTAARGCRCSARRSTSTPRSSTTRRATPWPPPRRSRRTCARRSRPAPTSTAAKAVGKLVAERAVEGRRQGRGLRPRRLSLSRPRQGAGRRRPRRRLELLRFWNDGPRRR